MKHTNIHYKIYNTKVVANVLTEKAQKSVKTLTLYFKKSNLPYVYFLPYKLIIKTKPHNKKITTTTIIVYYLHKGGSTKTMFHDNFYFPEYIFSSLTNDNGIEVISDRVAACDRYKHAKKIADIIPILQQMYTKFYKKHNIFTTTTIDNITENNNKLIHCNPIDKRNLAFYNFVYSRADKKRVFIPDNQSTDNSIPVKGHKNFTFYNGSPSQQSPQYTLLKQNNDYLPYFCKKRIRELYTH